VLVHRFTSTDLVDEKSEIQMTLRDIIPQGAIAFTITSQIDLR
jgi:hypothetical protein